MQHGGLEMKPENVAVILVSVLALIVVCGCGPENSQTTQSSGEKHFERALDYQDQQETRLAKMEYRLAIKASPEDSRSYVNLAILHLNENNLVTAVGYLEEAVKINPQDYHAYNLLGGIEIRRGRRDRAVTYYSRALELAPKYAEAHYNIAGAYRRLAQHRKAAEHYRAYIKFASPDDKQAITEATSYVDEMGEDTN